MINLINPSMGRFLIVLNLTNLKILEDRIVVIIICGCCPTWLRPEQFGVSPPSS